MLLMSGGVSVLERVIEPARGGFSAEHAQYVLSLDFSAEEHARYKQLSAKAQDGTLSADEQRDLDELLTADALLTILQSKARISLAPHNSAA